MSQSRVNYVCATYPLTQLSRPSPTGNLLKFYFDLVQNLVSFNFFSFLFFFTAKAGIVVNLLLNFEQKLDSCSYEIVRINKKSVMNLVILWKFNLAEKNKCMF